MCPAHSMKSMSSGISLSKVFSCDVIVRDWTSSLHSAQSVHEVIKRLRGFTYSLAEPSSRLMSLADYAVYTYGLQKIPVQEFHRHIFADPV